MTPVAFLITDLHLGGSPRLLRDLALGLRASGHFAPTIISLKPLPTTPHSIPQTLRQNDIPIHTLNLQSLRKLPQAVGGLKRILDQVGPDFLYSILIHANALATLTLPFLQRRPKFIQSIHTLQPNPAWHWTLQGILAPYADAIVTPSEPILTRIAAHGPFTRGVVIPNGVDVDRFANAESIPPETLPWPPSAPVVGYIGRFDPVKNLPLLLRAFARLVTQHALEPHPGTRPPHLALIGYGSQEPLLRTLATSLHIAPHVHFIPPTPTPERWYKSFTLHCLPSTVEGFGLTIVEAIAAGIPVVAIDSPVYADMGVERFGGLLVPPDDTALTQALQRVITQQQPRLHPAPPTPISPPITSPAALQFAQKHFSIRRMVELHEDFFKNFPMA